MKKINIKNHLWMLGGSVGIDARIEDDIEVTISTRGKDNKLLYPGVYTYPKNKLTLLPKRKFKRGVPVRVLPIRAMENIDEKETHQEQAGQSNESYSQITWKL